MLTCDDIYRSTYVKAPKFIESSYLEAWIQSSCVLTPFIFLDLTLTRDCVIQYGML